MKIIALLLTSVLMMAEVSAGEISSSENDVLLDSSFIHTFQKAMNECTEIRIEVEFLQTKNEFGNMSHHNNRCIGSKYCKCRVYSFDEFRSLQTALLADKSDRETATMPKTIDLKDRNTALMNFRNSLSIPYRTNTKTLAAAFSIDKEENVLVCSRGFFPSTFTYFQVLIEKLFKTLMELP